MKKKKKKKKKKQGKNIMPRIRYEMTTWYLNSKINLDGLRW